MFEKYTERARRALFFARYEVSELGGTAIETEHLLLGLLRAGKGLTSELFERAHMTVESVRKDIESRRPAAERVPTSVEIPFSAETKRILHAAADEAQHLDHNYIGTEHLCLGILREPDTVAGRLLVESGITLTLVRQEVIRVTKSQPRE